MALFLSSMFYTAVSSADCQVDAPAKRTRINILSNSFPVVDYFADEMKKCGENARTLQMRARLTPEHLELKKLALPAKGNAPYQIMQVSNSDFEEFVAKGWVAPITDLVAKYRSEYNLNDIPQYFWDGVTRNGEIYAVPIQQNLQHFFYRKDLFDKHNIAAPNSYAEVIAAASQLQGTEVDYPVAHAFGRGWNLATEFTNIYLSLDGQWFDNNLNPVFHTDGKGEQAIALLAQLLEHASPNALSFSSDDVMVAFQQGKAAMGNVWATRAGNMDDPEVSTVVGEVFFAHAPFTSTPTIPASSGFWDGYMIPANVDPELRELAFQIILEATDQESMTGAGALGGFLSRESITSDPTFVAKNRHWPAMLATVKEGVRAYPGTPHFGLAHTALGTNVADALAGQISARDALNKAAAEYIAEAKAKGFIK